MFPKIAFKRFRGIKSDKLQSKHCLILSTNFLHALRVLNNCKLLMIFQGAMPNSNEPIKAVHIQKLASHQSLCN